MFLYNCYTCIFSISLIHPRWEIRLKLKKTETIYVNVAIYFVGGVRGWSFRAYCPSKSKKERRKSSSQGKMQLRRANECRLFSRDKRIVGEVSWIRNWNDHHQNWKVGFSQFLTEKNNVNTFIFYCIKLPLTLYK